MRTGFKVLVAGVLATPLLVFVGFRIATARALAANEAAGMSPASELRLLADLERLHGLGMARPDIWRQAAPDSTMGVPYLRQLELAYARGDELSNFTGPYGS